MGPLRCIRRASGFAALVAGLVFVAQEAAGSAAVAGATGSAELRVVVSEQPGLVRLRVLLPDDVPPGSVEVQVAERTVVVLGRGTDGTRRRSRRLQLFQPVVEEGARAEYEPDGWLTITLRARPEDVPSPEGHP